MWWEKQIFSSSNHQHRYFNFPHFHKRKKHLAGPLQRLLSGKLCMVLLNQIKWCFLSKHDTFVKFWSFQHSKGRVNHFQARFWVLLEPPQESRKYTCWRNTANKNSPNDIFGMLFNVFLN